MTNVWSNWSGWVKSWPAALLDPTSEEELAAAVRDGIAPIRAAGSGHSFTPLVESQGTIISLRNMSGIIDHDDKAQTARIKAGTIIRDLGPLLLDRGMGLVNQGDIDSQTLAGAVGTGTHGTGGDLGSLSTSIESFRLVAASGEIIHASREKNTDIFNAGRVSMGSLGIMSEITMKLCKAYTLEETGGRMPIDEALARVNELRDAHRHFEFFWFPYSPDVIVKFLNETEAEANPREWSTDDDRGETRDEKIFRFACELSRYLPFLRGQLQNLLTAASGRYLLPAEAAGKARWSYDAFPSERHNRFNEMEYAVPAEKGPECLREVGAYMRRCRINFMFPLEYRYVAADDIWLSPFYERDSVTISVHQYYRQPYQELFEGAENIFRRYQGRPHWGKLHTARAAELKNLYPRWDDFLKLRSDLDPNGKFLNPYLRDIFGVY